MCMVGRGNVYGLERLYVWLREVICLVGRGYMFWFGEAICLVERGNLFGWAR